jgi:hypothetical protein
MSDTPRTDAAIGNAQDRSWMDGTLCRQLERELAAADTRINRLEKVLTDLVMELDAYLRPWNQPQKDPSNKAKRLDLAEDVARFEIGPRPPLK